MEKAQSELIQQLSDEVANFIDESKKKGVLTKATLNVFIANWFIDNDMRIKENK